MGAKFGVVLINLLIAVDYKFGTYIALLYGNGGKDLWNIYKG